MELIAGIPCVRVCNELDVIIDYDTLEKEMEAEDVRNKSEAMGDDYVEDTIDFMANNGSL